MRMLAAQTSTPTLNCLEVLPNGNVALHITPSSDPGNQFSHYEVLASISKTGPFSVVIPSITPISTSVIVHSSTVAVVQQYFYVVRAVELDNDRSENSDTLGTIFLNIYSKTPALELEYNSPRGFPGTFTITRQQPPAAPVTLTVTTSEKHYDVISQCSVNLIYQVLQQHSSGCVSKSNSIDGWYSDTKYPDELSVDSISVLPDGRTILAWTEAPDFDVDSYFVIQRFENKNAFIAAFRGRDSTSWIFDSTTALNEPVKLSVMAKDSCSKQSTFDERPVTMHLRYGYDYCNYITKLEWTRYQAMRNGIREYRIYCSINNGPYQLIGVTGNSTFEHDSIPPLSQLSYFIRVVNGDGSITASSNRIYFFSREVPIPGLNHVRAATVTREQNIDVQLVVDQDITFTTLDIQRSGSGGNYVTIGTIPYAGGAYYTFNDLQAEPGKQPYYYRAILRDSCGNARGISNISRTIFLKVQPGEEGYRPQLNWTPYQGFRAGVSEYRVYRVVNNEFYNVALASTPSHVTTFTDDVSEIASLGSDIAYYVEAVENTASSQSFYATANSNLVPVYVEGLIYVPNAFAPNGVNKTWKPVTHFVDHADYRVKVFNRWGQEVFYANDHHTSWDGKNCPGGVYVYLITYKNARGEYKEQKGTILLLE